MDNKPWKREWQSWAIRNLIYSPETYTYNIGLCLLNSTANHGTAKCEWKSSYVHVYLNNQPANSISHWPWFRLLIERWFFWALTGSVCMYVLHNARDKNMVAMYSLEPKDNAQKWKLSTYKSCSTHRTSLQTQVHADLPTKDRSSGYNIHHSI